MLEALRSVPPGRAEEALSRAIDAFLPNTSPVELDDLAARLVYEARAKAGDDEGAAADRLGEELAALLLPPGEEQAAKDRLGHDGDLPLANYDVDFDPTWSRGAPDRDDFFSVEPEEAAAAFSHGVRADHVSRDRFRPTNPEGQAAMLVASRVRSLRGERHWMLLSAMKRGSTAFLTSAWRLFPDEVPVHETMSPRQMLVRFLARYGMDVELVGTTGPVRLVWDVKAPGRNLTLGRRGGNPLFVHRGMMAYSDQDHWHVFIAWAVNVELYARAVAKHGYSVSLQPRQGLGR